jgi:uncharacterized protein
LSTPHPVVLPSPPTEGRPIGTRIAALDVLRGFALCGILFVNIRPISHWGYEASVVADRAPDFFTYLFGLAFTERMFPLFALLFGMGFVLFLESATARSARPRLVLLRRLIVLLGIGVLHFVVYPGEVLATYAVVAIAVLLPSSFLPRWVVAVGGVLMTVVAAPVGGQFLVPGLFLLGAAIIRYRVLDVINRRPRLLLAFFAVSFIGAVGTSAWLAGNIINAGFGPASSISGLVTMFAFASGLLLLMRNGRVASGLQRVFAPLGRMALTNYLSATIVVALASRIFELPALEWQTGYAVLVAAVVLPLQWLASWLWLRSFRYGPAEWLWRTATWWAPQPMKRATRAAEPVLPGTLGS